jgi:hypothetical protein
VSSSRTPALPADDEEGSSLGRDEETRIIRPAAVLNESSALLVLAELRRLDVTRGGPWKTTASLWQRYDGPFTGAAGDRGSAQLLGSIAVMYDAPLRREITIYKVTVSPAGLETGWAVESLTDDALAHAGLTLATCPRASMADPPPRDPFWPRRP